MSFFESEIVQKELNEISILQEELYNSVKQFPYMKIEEKIYHIDLLEKLLEKQKVLYARLSLSDDDKAKKLKDRINESASMLGLPRDYELSAAMNQMSESLKNVKIFLDKYHQAD
jgi:hypothetical protein